MLLPGGHWSLLALRVGPHSDINWAGTFAVVPLPLEPAACGVRAGAANTQSGCCCCWRAWTAAGSARRLPWCQLPVSCDGLSQ